MSVHPLISVGLMTRNRAEFLPATLESLLSQTEGRFELIISDNASSDKTQTVCEEYARRDSRIRYVRQDQDIGLPANFNQTLSMASGRFFMWAGDDDLWDRDFIRELLMLLERHQDAALAMSHFDNFQDDAVFPVKPRKFNNEASWLSSVCRYMLTGDIICVWGMYRTTALKDARGFHSDSRPCHRHSDYLTVFKVLLRGKAVFVDKVLFHKRDAGICHVKYQRLRDLRINKRMFEKMIRFLAQTIFFLYDLVLSLASALSARLPVSRRIAVALLTVPAYLAANLRFFRELLMGVVWLVIGMVRKVFVASGSASSRSHGT